MKTTRLPSTARPARGGTARKTQVPWRQMERRRTDDSGLAAAGRTWNAVKDIQPRRLARLMIGRRWLTGVGVAVLTHFARAGDYHVSPAGDDSVGSGSVASPWRSLCHAVEEVPQGAHTIHLAAGNYPENSPILLRPGLSVLGAGPDVTIVQNGYFVEGSDFDFLLRLDSAVDGVVEAGNQELAGFHLQGVNHAERTRQSGIRIRGRANVTLRQLKFSAMAHGGLDIRARDAVAGAPPSEFVTGIKVSDCEFVDTAALLGDGSYGNLMLGGIDGGEFSHLKVTESRGAGIRDWGGGWLRNTKIHHCRIDMMPPNRQSLAPGDHSPAIQLTEVAENCEIHHCELNNWLVLTHSAIGAPGTWNLRIYANTFLSDHLFVEQGGGQPFRIANHGVSRVEIAGNHFAQLSRSYVIWCGPQQGDIIQTSIHHNTFHGHGEISYGILCQPQLARDMSDIRVVNNTFLNVQQAVFVQPLGGQKASDVQLANNLCLDDDPLISPLTPQFDLRATDGVITSGFVRNNYFHGFAREKGVMQFGDSTLDLMPSTQIFRYAAGASPEPLPILANGPDPVPYFRLRPALVDAPNAAIDAGVVLAGYTDGVPGPPDIGAFEWYANDPTPLSPLTIFREGTQLALRWSSTAGSSYLIEASSTLASGSWTAATGPILADPLRTETAFLLPAEPVAAHRYYRVRKTQ